jgi:hypothetical protein
MSIRSIATSALAAALLAASTSIAFADSCIDCHSALPDPLGTPTQGFDRDVHKAAGLSCADCHGGDPTVDGEEAMDKAKGFVGKPATADIPEFCGRCHANKTFMRRFSSTIPTTQLAEYRTSRHGIALAKGNVKVATCVSCHGVHGILPVSDAKSPVHKTNVAQTCGSCHANAAYMAGTGLRTDQLALYLRSVHGQRLMVDRDVAAPTCPDCHGNHGAAPPGVDSVGAVCGSCHVIQHEMFSASPHRAAFERLGLLACANHHGDHGVAPTSDAMVGVGPESTCLPCHAAGSAGYQTAAGMSKAIAELRASIAAATGVLEDAQHAGMEVSEAEYSMKSAHDSLIQARNLVHTASLEQLRKTADAGLKISRHGEEVGRGALQELSNRKSLAIIPLAVIALVAGFLFLKIRSLGGPVGRDR